MEFWPENAGQLPPYAKFGTVPGRNCTQNYHDRHQATHYPPVYYGEQQDRGRESTYWTMPGSRVGATLQEYTNWTDPELTAPTSAHFPFILERHTQQHQDLGEYEPQEARDRKWMVAQQAARDYERGYLREGLQRRWEPCSSVRYNREVSKRSDSSYRELEAWAARYSHSLPRRRRIEAELRGASQGLLESSRAAERDSRTGTDSRVAALQQVRPSASMRDSGLWDRAVRQQTYPPQVPDTRHSLEERTGYQRRMFSQPPGYIAPPPYNSPHKCSPVMQHCDTSWEQEGKRQTYWSQPTFRKQDVSVDQQDEREREKQDFQKTEANQRTRSDFEGLKHPRQDTDTVQESNPVSIQNAQIQECMLPLQQPQTLQEAQKINEASSPKVIEGRKFRLNKKTGGMTIFCLVSRIAGTTDTPSLPLCTQTKIENPELGKVSKIDSDVTQAQKLADEVDYKAPTFTEQPNLLAAPSGTKSPPQTELPTCSESTMLLSDKDETDVSAEKTDENKDSTFERQVAPSVSPVSVRYPLWREPSFTSRAGTESPPDVDLRRLNFKKDTESEDRKGLLVIDTTSTVVKLELIPSPKKEHVHYLDSTAAAEHSPSDNQSTVPEVVPSNDLLNVGEAAEQNTEINPSQTNERTETESNSDLVENKALEVGSEISFPVSVSERETLQERAERILGIPLHDCATEQQTGDEASLLELSGADQGEEVESPPMNLSESTADEQSQDDLEREHSEDAPSLGENKEDEDLESNEGVENPPGSEAQESNVSEESSIDCQLVKDTNNAKEVERTEDPLNESTHEGNTSEQSCEDNQPVENVASQFFSPPPDLPLSISLPSSLDSEESNPSLALMLSPSALTSLSGIESNTEGSPDPESGALDSAEEPASPCETSPSQQPTYPIPPGSTEPSPLDLIVETVKGMSTINSCSEDQSEEEQTSQLMENMISNSLDKLSEDKTAELLSHQQSECGPIMDAPSFVEDSNMTEEQLTTELSEQSADRLDQTQQVSEELPAEFNIVQKRFECPQAEDAGGDEEGYVIEERTDSELLEQTPEISKENVMEVKNVQHQTDHIPAEQTVGLEEGEYQSQTDNNEHQAGLVEQTAEENATDCQAEIHILHDTELLTEPFNSSSSPSDVEACQFLLPSPPHESHKSNREFVSHVEVESSCPSALHPDPAADIPDTFPPPLFLLDPDEKSLWISSSSPPEYVPPSSSPPPGEESGSVCPDLLPKQEPQYPKSLWDAVNRIRKHTAPDSENEEEEVTELWDPESAGEDLSCPDVDVMSCGAGTKQQQTASSPCCSTTGEKGVFDETGQHEVSEGRTVEDVEAGQFQPDQCQEQPSRQTAEEDTLSCCSTSSHDSGDTVIVADEDELEEAGPDVKTEVDGEGGQYSCDDVTDITAGEEEGDGVGAQGDTESCKSDEQPAEVNGITKLEVEMMETEQKQNEEELFTASEMKEGTSRECCTELQG